MARSWTKFNQYGFWAHDSFVEAMQLCLIQEIENAANENDTQEWQDEFKFELALQSLPLVFGGMEMGLQTFLINKTRIKIVSDYIDIIIVKIESEPNYLTGINLHLMRKRAMEILKEAKDTVNDNNFALLLNDSRWDEASPEKAKHWYIHAFTFLRKLINGELKITLYSPIDYWDL